MTPHYLDDQNRLYAPHIDQAVDDDRVCRRDHVQHRRVFWMVRFSARKEKTP